jgi:hypothetical protein
MEIRPEFLTKSNAKHGKLLERRGVVEFPMETDTLVLTQELSWLVAQRPRG